MKEKEIGELNILFNKPKNTRKKNVSIPIKNIEKRPDNTFFNKVLNKIPR